MRHDRLDSSRKIGTKEHRCWRMESLSARGDHDFRNCRQPKLMCRVCRRWSSSRMKHFNRRKVNLHSSSCPSLKDAAYHGFLSDIQIKDQLLFSKDMVNTFMSSSISDQKHMRQNLKQWSSCKCLWSHCMLRCHSFTICCVTIYQVPSSYVWCLQAACADAAAPVSHAYRAFDRDLWPMHVNSRRAGEQQEKPLKI